MTDRFLLCAGTASTVVTAVHERHSPCKLICEHKGTETGKFADMTHKVQGTAGCMGWILDPGAVSS